MSLEDLKVVNKPFTKLKDAFVLEKFEKDVYEFIINEDEQNFIDLSPYFEKYGELYFKETCLDKTVQKLKNFGWNVAFSFGDTGLFIYSTPVKPLTCW